MDDKNFTMSHVENLIDEFNYLNKNEPELIKKVFQKKSGVRIKEYNALYEKFEDMHLHPEQYNGVKTKTKGNILEEIVRNITIETKIFELFANVSNESNEYDIIVKPSELATLSYNALPKIIYQPIICECKNYKAPVDVTWIGKLYMLLSISNIKLGIIFSYEGITGGKDTEWHDAKGLVKKIFLKDGIAIIDISKPELDLIKKGENLYTIIQKKYDDLVFMTNIEKYKVKHISSEKVNKIINDIDEEVEYYKKEKFKNT